MPTNVTCINILPLLQLIWPRAYRGYSTNPFPSRSQPFLASLLFPDNEYRFHDAGEDARALNDILMFIVDWYCEASEDDEEDVDDVDEEFADEDDDETGWEFAL